MQFAIAAEQITKLERSDDIGYFSMPVRVRGIMTRCGATRELRESEFWLLEDAVPPHNSSGETARLPS